MALDAKKAIEVAEKSLFSLFHKKTKNLNVALYLVTAFIDDSDPLKWKIRESVVYLLSLSVKVKDISSVEAHRLYEEVKSVIYRIVSMLEVAHYSGFISEMNFRLLIKEFESLELIITSDGSLLRKVGHTDIPRNLLNTSEHNDFIRQEDSGDQEKTLEKKQFLLRIKNIKDMSFKKNVLYKNKIPKSKSGFGGKGVVEEKKQKREAIILKLIKEKEEISVKDVSQVIRDCSEKTLQRELLAMVERGDLRKNGERRWSRYSINS